MKGRKSKSWAMAYCGMAAALLCFAALSGAISRVLASGGGCDLSKWRR